MFIKSKERITIFFLPLTNINTLLTVVPYYILRIYILINDSSFIYLYFFIIISSPLHPSTFFVNRPIHRCLRVEGVPSFHLHPFHIVTKKDNCRQRIISLKKSNGF
jgi:hypothetical protein